MENRLPQIRQGDHVIYKNSGVCTVKEIALRAFGSLPPKEYYVLTRVADGADVYVPVAAGETLLTRLYTEEQIRALIAAAEQITDVPPENSKLRINAYDKALASGDRAKILWLMKILSRKEAEEAEKNKRLCTGEARILGEAKRIITEEFGYALHLSPADVVPYILRQINAEPEKDA